MSVTPDNYIVMCCIFINIMLMFRNMTLSDLPQPPHANKISGPDSIPEPRHGNPIPQDVLARIAMTEAQACHEAVAEPDPGLVAKYRAFDTAFGPFSGGTIYHPCCAYDSSPSKAFGDDNRVVYVDQSEPDIAALRAAGQGAHVADAKTFNPGPVDVLIMLNPAIEASGPTSHVKPGGFVLANNYHGTASELRETPEFELVGIIHDRTEDGSAVVDTDHPEQHWQKVENDEEFRASPEYSAIKMQVKMATGKEISDLASYQAIIQDIMEKHPDARVDDGYLFWNENGAIKIMPFSLPPKKGHVDDFYVFRRKLV